MLSGDLSFVGGGTIITIAGGGGVQFWQPRAMVSAAMVVSFLDAFCWWAFVFVCCFGWLRFSEDSGS